MLKWKQRLTGSLVLKKIAALSEGIPDQKPLVAFIGKLPDGSYEVSEHIERGEGRDFIVDTPEDYFTTRTPNWTVIYDDLPMIEMLKRMLSDPQYFEKLALKAEERLIG